MRVEYINPFVEAAFEILHEVLECEVKRGELYLKEASLPIMGVAIFIGLTGKVKGRVIFDMTKETCLKIASKMNNETMAELDDMVKATITELANMITGLAITKLNNSGFDFEITPPSIITGERMHVTDYSLEALIIPIITDYGTIEVNVVIKEEV